MSARADDETPREQRAGLCDRPRMHTLISDCRSVGSHSAPSPRGEVFSLGVGAALGHETQEERLTPMMIEALRGHRIVQVACGAQHCVALSSAGVFPAGGERGEAEVGMLMRLFS